jgi:tRNA A-37 threonylcarbamoyl transferase component Bud32
MLNKDELAEKIQALTGWKVDNRRFKIVTDTSDWMAITKGDVIRIDGRDFVVRGNMHEPRFGIDEQPKYWVFNAIELETGEEKIIKTVFYEEFYVHISIFKIRCYRSPEKEAQVLEQTRGDERFMQGKAFLDEKGNNVRIIDFIRGKTLFHFIPSISKPHEQYFFEDFPIILTKLADSISAIQKLHNFGLCHGDIRNDHILIDAADGAFRWIDFDLKQDVTDFDVWSMGNLLSYCAGKGILTFSAVLKDKNIETSIKESLKAEDSSAFYEYRIMNLQKVYPYMPEGFSNLLRHFTIRPVGFFRNINEFTDKFFDTIQKEFNITFSPKEL